MHLPLPDQLFVENMFSIWWGTPLPLRTRAVESESREVGKSLKIGKNLKKWDKKSDKIGKIGFDFISDFLAKMPKGHKMP